MSTAPSRQLWPIALILLGAMLLGAVLAFVKGKQREAEVPIPAERLPTDSNGNKRPGTAVPVRPRIDFDDERPKSADKKAPDAKPVPIKSGKATPRPVPKD